MIESIILDIVFDWSFLSPLTERSNMETIREVDNTQEQTMAQMQVTPEVYY